MLLTVHDGKGQKDRTVPLPARALAEIREQMDFVRRLHAQDLAAGYAGTFLPRQLEKKYKNAARGHLAVVLPGTHPHLCSQLPTMIPAATYGVGGWGGLLMVVAPSGHRRRRVGCRESAAVCH